ncbi:CxC2 domain-containing protein [Mycena kentingensis (nom. inval.)]|nr:CxC2 domain-containing protein [Mycena kentingensis (nom. inval.)]
MPRVSGSRSSDARRRAADRPTRKRDTFRAGGVHLPQHGDLGTHFRSDGRGVKTALVNLAPAVNPHRPSEILDPLGGWSPMPGGEGEGWEDEVVEIQIEATPAKRRRYVSSVRTTPCDFGASAAAFTSTNSCLERGLDATTTTLAAPSAAAPASSFFDAGIVAAISNAKTVYGTLICANLFIARRTELTDVSFCACSDSFLHPHGHVSQLIDNGWYPATTLDPTTCATFRLLDLFRLMKVAGNANANDFVRVLERATDATLTRKVPERYKSFVRMARQWDFLTRAKRAGRGNCPNGISTTEPGGLAVWCWACPDPARNLPAGWQNAAAEEAYLYALILALDANFRLKNRIRANERHDPSLIGGFGYFVLLAAYKEFLRHYVAEDDVSTCIAFQALMQKETRLTTGLRVSGVGGCVCARHGLVRPLGIGDLQKGERYANMDWILLSAMNGTEVKRVVLSYDIACQWKQRLAGTGGEGLGGGGSARDSVGVVHNGDGRAHDGNGNGSVLNGIGCVLSGIGRVRLEVRRVNLDRRVLDLGRVLNGIGRVLNGIGRVLNGIGRVLDLGRVLNGIGRANVGRRRLGYQYGMPPPHDAGCQAAMSLSHLVGAGRTDGEGIERTWAILNPIAYSTKEMGEGHRHETIDNKIDNINFLKNVGQGDTLARKYLISLAARDIQVAEFEQVDASLEPWMRREWQQMIDAWNADNSRPNPYVLKGKQAGLTESEILAELKKAELEDVREGRGETLKGKMTGVAFVKAGLQLENAQRRIKAEIKATTTMTAERASQIDELRVSFFKKLRSWQTQQAVFMPIALALREAEEEDRNREEPAPAAEDTKLWLPSDLSDAQRRNASVRGLAKIEGRLREGQCGDALARVRGSLQAKHHMVNHRNANAVGQMASTRSNTVIGRIDGQGHRQVLKYRQARAAGRCLEGDAFAPMFRELHDDDVRMGIEVESDAQARTELGRVGNSRRVRNEPSAAKRVQPLSWIWLVGGEADDEELHDSIRVQWTKARARRDRWVEEVELIREEMRRVLRSLTTVQREWQEREDGRIGADAELVLGARAYARRQRAIFGRIATSFQLRWSASPAQAVRQVVVEEDVDAEDTEAGGGGGVVEIDAGDPESGGESEDGMEEAKAYNLHPQVQFLQHRILYVWFLYPEIPDERTAVSYVLRTQPAAWRSLLNDTTSVDILALLRNAEHHEEALITAWSSSRLMTTLMAQKESASAEPRRYYRRKSAAAVDKMEMVAESDSEDETPEEEEEQRARRDALTVNTRRNRSNRTKINWPRGGEMKGHKFTRDDSVKTEGKGPGDCFLCTSPYHHPQDEELIPAPNHQHAQPMHRFPIDPLYVHLGTVLERVTACRLVRINNNLHYLWSANAQHIPFLPGLPPNDFNVLNYKPVHRRPDNSKGQFDYMHYPQFLTTVPSWAPWLRWTCEPSDAELPIYRPLTEVWVDTMIERGRGRISPPAFESIRKFASELAEAIDRRRKRVASLATDHFELYQRIEQQAPRESIGDRRWDALRKANEWDAALDATLRSRAY